MPHVEVSQLMRCAQPQTIYALIRDMERYPEFMPDLRGVKVIARTEHTTITEWVSKVEGILIRWRELDSFDDENLHITYRQISGDLKKFEGEWRIDGQKGGAQVTLTADFDLGIPMIAGMVHPILQRKIHENCVSMLTAIEKELYKSIDSRKENTV